MAVGSWAYPFLSYSSRPPSACSLGAHGQGKGKMKKTDGEWPSVMRKSWKKCFLFVTVLCLLPILVLLQRLEDWGLENLRDLSKVSALVSDGRVLQLWGSYFIHFTTLCDRTEIRVLNMACMCYLSSPTPANNFYLKFFKYPRLPLPSGPLLPVLPLSGMFFLVSIWMSLISQNCAKIHFLSKTFSTLHISWVHYPLYLSWAFMCLFLE